MHAVVVVAAIALATVNGSGVKKTESRPVEAFSAVETGGAWNVEIASGAKHALEISGDDNVVPLIETKVTGGVLTISTSESIENIKVPVVVKLTMPSLDRLVQTGAGNVAVKDVKTAATLSIELSGAGSLSFKGPAQNVSLKATGAGNMNLTGKATSLDAFVAGAGNVDASAFEVQRGIVKVNGAGNVAVNATGTLDVTVNGMGNVVYSGNPKLTQSMNGIGSIRKKGAPAAVDASVPPAVPAVPAPPAPPKRRGGW